MPVCVQGSTKISRDVTILLLFGLRGPQRAARKLIRVGIRKWTGAKVCTRVSVHCPDVPELTTMMID